jgi:hypothetical protein
MDPRVLAAPGPHLAHASYVGLVHAGEPTIAPLCGRCSSGCARPAAAAPTVVHLLTNGMALDEARFVELARARGALALLLHRRVTPETNDRLRVGSRVEKLLALLPALARPARSGEARTCGWPRLHRHRLETWGRRRRR